ncbi:MAG: c-type cytochrome [Formosimonas sp.]
MRRLAPLALCLLAACEPTPPAPVQPTSPLPPPATLAIQKNCIACHNATGNMVGPAWQTIAKQYKNDTNAATRLTDKVLTGGKGSFGNVAMPPQATKLTPDEARYLVAWILGQ